MNIEILRQYCLSKKGSSEDTPFDEVTLCFRVAGKIFAILPLDSLPQTINLKCDPEWAIELREAYTDIQQGFHMNKKHWNTIYIEGSLPPSLILKMIDHSYDCVVKSLKKIERAALQDILEN